MIEQAQMTQSLCFPGMEAICIEDFCLLFVLLHNAIHCWEHIPDSP